MRGYNYSQHLCYSCSTIEGESELSTHYSRAQPQLATCTPLHWCNNNHLVPLHWCCDVRPCSGTALYTEWISTQPPIQKLPSVISSHQLEKPYRTTAHHALHCLCLVSESTFISIFVIMLMSACCSLRSCSPLKTVF